MRSPSFHIRFPYHLCEDLTPLKVKRAVPVLIRLTLRITLPLPQRISTFAPTLMLHLVPELVGPAVRSTCLFPEQEGALANDLIQTLLSLRQHTKWIWVRFERSTATDMHADAQGLELLVRHQLGVSRGLQRLLLEAIFARLGSSPIADRDRKRVQNSLACFDVD